MTLDCSKAGKAKMNMRDHVETVLKELPPDMRGEAATPASDHLFDIHKEAETLPKEVADTLHHAMLLKRSFCQREQDRTHRPLWRSCALG